MKDITIYTTKTCVYCKQLARWLDNRGDKYQLKDVTDDVETRKELYAKTSYTTVPIVKIGDKYIVGPQYGKIAELLG